MIRFARAAAFALAAFVATPAMANPAGIWEIEMRDSRFNVAMCGDGTQLCAELIWLGNGADSAENLPYLNTLLVNGAHQTRANQWKGDINLYGKHGGGTLTMVGPDQITVKGCIAFVLCRTYQMYRVAG